MNARNQNTTVAHQAVDGVASPQQGMAPLDGSGEMFAGNSQHVSEQSNDDRTPAASPLSPTNIDLSIETSNFDRVSKTPSPVHEEPELEVDSAVWDLVWMDGNMLKSHSPRMAMLTLPLALLFSTLLSSAYEVIH